MTRDDLIEEVGSLRVRAGASEARIRKLEKMLDTRATPLWRRIMFRIDGWGPWWRIAREPAWRPWRRWWTS